MPTLLLILLQELGILFIVGLTVAQAKEGTKHWGFFPLVSDASEPVMGQEKDYLHTEPKIRAPLSLDSLPPYNHLVKLLLLCKY